MKLPCISPTSHHLSPTSRRACATDAHEALVAQQGQQRRDAARIDQAPAARAVAHETMCEPQRDKRHVGGGVAAPASALARARAPAPARALPPALARAPALALALAPALAI